MRHVPVSKQGVLAQRMGRKLRRRSGRHRRNGRTDRNRCRRHPPRRTRTSTVVLPQMPRTSSIRAASMTVPHASTSLEGWSVSQQPCPSRRAPRTRTSQVGGGDSLPAVLTETMFRERNQNGAERPLADSECSLRIHRRRLISRRTLRRRQARSVCDDARARAAGHRHEIGRRRRRARQSPFRHVRRQGPKD